VVREYGTNPHEMGMKNPFMAQGRQTCMGVNEVYMFSKNYGAKIGEKGEEIRQRCGRRDGYKGQIVDF